MKRRYLSHCSSDTDLKDNRKQIKPLIIGDRTMRRRYLSHCYSDTDLKDNRRQIKPLIIGDRDNEGDCQN